MAKDLYQKPLESRHSNIINVRKLTALDIVFHGPNFILAEFALGVFICAAFGIFSLYMGFFHSSQHSLFMTIMGCCLLWIALNYIPLFLYAISIVRHKSAEQEVAYELAYKHKYAVKYTLQSAILILAPLGLLILAVYQELQKRSYL